MLFKLINLVRKIQNLIYSLILKNGFISVGKNFFIEYPARLKGGEYITIGDDFYCFGRIRLEAYDKHNDYKYTPKITIGNNVSINFDCHIACVNKVIIGNGVLIASKVFITDHFHGDITKKALEQAPSQRKVMSKGEVNIEDNVWIGEGVCIMPDVRIGENCIIGANSVVTKSFPANSVIGGNPAKIIKTIQ